MIAPIYDGFGLLVQSILLPVDRQHYRSLTHYCLIENGEVLARAGWRAKWQLVMGVIGYSAVASEVGGFSEEVVSTCRNMTSYYSPHENRYGQCCTLYLLDHDPQQDMVENAVVNDRIVNE